MRPTRPSSDVAFTPSVKALQSRHGSRAAYARMEAAGGFATSITDDLARFIAAQTSFFLATANGAGQPYIQHRGGPAGFLRVLDASTLAFADFRGNKQYITRGNLLDNDKVQLFLIDYLHRQRVKIWGVATATDDPARLAALTPAAYDARVEQAIVITVSAWDANCPQHIPQLVEAADMAARLAESEARIAALEAALAAARRPR